MSLKSPDAQVNPDLSAYERSEAWHQLQEVCEQFYSNTGALPVTPVLDKKTIAEYAHRHSFDYPIAVEEAIRHVAEGLKTFAVHTPHPQYYGLFNPRPNFTGAVADTLTAFFNPQMAAWSHAPFAVESEQYVISQLGQKFGYSADEVDGVFSTGGAEANHTALLAALTWHFPDYARYGLQHISRRPVFYISVEGHHSFVKAAMHTGLGRDSIRMISVGGDLRMDMEALESQIKDDLANGYTPFMVVATLGTTGVGAIDDLNTLVVLKQKYSFWLHADSAFGGGLALSDEHRKLLGPVHQVDSITFDAHKWMSVPMGAGIFLTRHQGILKKTFAIDASYMPRDEGGLVVVDPYAHSIQWSRRFTGLKVYMSLLVLGWQGYKHIIDHTMRMGRYLHNRLQESGFEILNHTPLPIVCFRPGPALEKKIDTEKLHQAILEDRQMWLSLYTIHGQVTLRACIGNYSTTEGHIDQSIERILELMG